MKYPLGFMDFESLNPAIPRFAGMWPYSQIPFQWSVHRQLTPQAKLEHFEFLSDDERDPRPKFIQSVCSALGKRGQIVVYNAGFESQPLGELADWLPEYKERINNAVLPALIPHITSEGMEVSHGGQAGLAWEKLIRGGLDPDERRLKDALLAYCRQDTLAMAKILERLRAFRLNG